MYLSPYNSTSPQGLRLQAQDIPFILEYKHSTHLVDQTRADSSCTACLWQYKQFPNPTVITLKHDQYFIQEQTILLWKNQAFASLICPKTTLFVLKKKLSVCSPFMVSTWHTQS